MPGIAGIQLGISILGISMLGISILGISILGISGMPGIPLLLPGRWWQGRASGSSKQHQQSLAHTLINLAPSREPTPPHCQRGRHMHRTDDRGRVKNVPHRRAVCSSVRPHRGRTWVPSREGILVLCSVHRKHSSLPLSPLPEGRAKRGPGACSSRLQAAALHAVGHKPRLCLGICRGISLHLLWSGHCSKGYLFLWDRRFGTPRTQRVVKVSTPRVPKNNKWYLGAFVRDTGLFGTK